MENNKFYIKRVKFIKNKNNSENINNLWVICFETGDRMVKVSNYLKPIILDEFLLNHTLLSFKSLIEITQKNLNSILYLSELYISEIFFLA